MSLLVPPRRPSHEILDETDLDPDEMARSLEDLELVNTALGSARLLEERMADQIRLDGASRATILDVGAGSASVARELEVRLEASAAQELVHGRLREQRRVVGAGDGGQQRVAQGDHRGNDREEEEKTESGRSQPGPVAPHLWASELVFRKAIRSPTSFSPSSGHGRPRSLVRRYIAGPCRQSAAAIVTDSQAHIHIGCTFGDKVLKTLRKALDADKSKSYVVEVSPLGLVEMTRQNVTDGVREILTKRCPTCDGEGVVASEETVAISIVRKLQEVVEEDPKPEAYLIRVNPRVAAELLTPDSGLTELEDETGKRFHFEGGDALSLDTFHVVETGTREEIEQRALPFQVGEEVLVSIEEPHMYNVDDAVARVDSYVVSVAGAGPHVGEQRMVRIESVGRSAATAALLDSDGNVVEAGANGNGGERLESAASGGRRRRGSRGGRRRSRAGGGSKN